MTTIDISSVYAANPIYAVTEVQVEDEGYALMVFKWSGIAIGAIQQENDSGSSIERKAIPEIIVEQSDSDGETWFPVYQQRTTYEEPVKFRLLYNSGEYSVNLYPLLPGSYVRFKVHFNGAVAGEIKYNIDTGA